MNPFLKPIKEERQLVDTMLGYNHNLRIGDGEFYDMENLSSDYAPVLSPREPRGLFKEGGSYQGIAIKGVDTEDSTAPVYAKGPDLYVGNTKFPMWLSDSPKQIIVMGDRIIVFPDRKYVNVKEYPPEAEADVKTLDSVMKGIFQITGKPCDLDGKPIVIKYSQEATPEAPADLDYWVDKSNGGAVLKQWSKSTGYWAAVAQPYVRLEADGIDNHFEKFDGIKLDFGYGPDVSAQLKTLDGYNIVWGKGVGYIVVVGILDKVYESSAAPITIERKAPDMDFVFESGNRLWGCKYNGYADNARNSTVNRIYCSALGDPTNWTRFMGLADDSYFAEVGTEGAFTGGCSFNGHPVFFKENVIHKVYGINPPFQIQEVHAQGVQNGCMKSIAALNDLLFYKSRSGVYVYDGSTPRGIYDAFGDVEYKDAVGAARDGKYYISMLDDGGKWNLFTYDLRKGLWHREDDLHAVDMVAGNRHIYAITEDRMQIITLDGGFDNDAQPFEPPIHWSAVTGDLALQDPNQKYISRLTVRMEVDPCSQVEIFVRYDQAREWTYVMAARGDRLKSLSLPIRPRRCDHMQLLIKGVGPCKLYSILKTIRRGSEIT